MLLDAQDAAHARLWGVIGGVLTGTCEDSTGPHGDVNNFADNTGRQQLQQQLQAVASTITREDGCDRSAAAEDGLEGLHNLCGWRHGGQGMGGDVCEREEDGGDGSDGDK